VGSTHGASMIARTCGVARAWGPLDQVLRRRRGAPGHALRRGTAAVSSSLVSTAKRAQARNNATRGEKEEGRGGRGTCL
jgi:hypothetical protein